MTDDKRDPGGWAEYQENLQRPLARDRRDARTPDRIFASADRQWAKTQTPICTEEYIRAAPTAKEGVRVRVTEEARVHALSVWMTSADPRQIIEAAARHMEVTVDWEFLRSLLERWTKQTVFFSEADTFAKRLGLTLTDGDSDA